jgi:hypothetical protein
MEFYKYGNATIVNGTMNRDNYYVKFYYNDVPF